MQAAGPGINQTSTWMRGVRKLLSAQGNVQRGMASPTLQAPEKCVSLPCGGIWAARPDIQDSPPLVPPGPMSFKH